MPVAAWYRLSSGKQSGLQLRLIAARPSVAGVRPETRLAKDAGLELGKRGGIRVDEHMLTSDPHVYAVGELQQAIATQAMFG